MTGIWKVWMDVWGWAMMASALVFLLAASTATEAPVLFFYDLIYWPLDGASQFTETTRPTSAILGAVFLGWMLTVRLLVNVAHAATAPVSAGLWRGLTSVIVVWYVLDSSASILTGIPVNAVSNTCILLGYLVPVLASGVLSAKPAGAAA